MSKQIEIEIEEALAEDNEIGDEDYGFIFDKDGNVKYVFVPDHLPFKPPKTIARVMKILGVTDLSQFQEDVSIHQSVAKKQHFFLVAQNGQSCYNLRMNKDIVFYLKWLATFVTIIGAICTSINLYPLGPALLNVGAFLWLIVAIKWREWSLITINATLLLIYTVGLVIKLAT